MSNPLHKGIKVTSVTITTVEAKCDRCKKKASGECGYPNHQMFVKEKLKYTTIYADRTSKSTYAKELLVCQDCTEELEDLFLAVPQARPTAVRAITLNPLWDRGRPVTDRPQA